MTCYGLRTRPCGTHDETLRPVTIEYASVPKDEQGQPMHKKVEVRVLCSGCITRLIDDPNVENFHVHKLNMWNQ